MAKSIGDTFGRCMEAVRTSESLLSEVPLYNKLPTLSLIKVAVSKKIIVRVNDAITIGCCMAAM